ncbi:carbohydrate esterase family 16 protein [Jaapia argillacea MUCL 33604]|uniref:Carbohydrate esterase family 16 protein n=1 Tax=Jaapia argillacea MUCL 33604 TaxID=933084 RepID=A0A067P676_9AGAM|nr:carbohydrate esterase family 16 protein [Jaapia argillacea MUCL 33604]
MTFHQPFFLSLFGLLCTVSFVQSKLTWNNTEYMFVFGDSYSSDGYNVSLGIDSPNPLITTSDGNTWVEYLSQSYNITNTKTFNLAYAGATIDAAFVPPYLPTVYSIVDQVTEFDTYLASGPPGATWNSSNSLFVTWIGLNDVGNSVAWTNVSHPELHTTILNRLFTQMEVLYTKGARSFLFLSVPPTNRAPVFYSQGEDVTSLMAYLIADYNYQLTGFINQFKANHTDINMAELFDTQVVFNTLLDNAATFGFVNTTGYCGAYINGTANKTTQVEGCAPVSSYFWLNTLHPVYTVHDILAKSISTFLSGYLGGGFPITF